MTRPLIAVALDRRLTSYPGWPDEPTDALFTQYVDLIEQAGGVALLVASTDVSVAAADRLARIADGVLVAGGRDIAAETYGHAPHLANDTPVLARDRLEIGLVRAAIDLGKPVLGICRGMQILNVALGGTLVQHLADHVEDPEHHLDGQFVDHRVTIDPDSRVGACLGSSLAVPSHHHQAVDVVGPGLRVVARAVDGVVEAVETIDADAFVIGVQWHPERKPEEAGLPLVEAFIAAADDRAAVPVL